MNCIQIATPQGDILGVFKAQGIQHESYFHFMYSITAVTHNLFVLSYLKQQ